jgi:hypothetical protein
MFPEDRVLVGVINRKRDLVYARDEHWYRIPQRVMPKGVHAEYMAFFLSKAFGEQNGAVHYFSERTGVELAYRKDLLPVKKDDPRAKDVYYQVKLAPLRDKVPPITNPTRRPITFVYTTWDRFFHAKTISDLYTKEDYFVDRVYHALRNKGVAPERIWAAEYKHAPAALKILCQGGTVTASTERGSGDFYLDDLHEHDEILAGIMKRIDELDGPAYLTLPSDYLSEIQL